MVFWESVAWLVDEGNCMLKQSAPKHFVLLLVTIALFITACGAPAPDISGEDNGPVPSGLNPTPYKEFTKQKVSWQPCDPSIIPADIAEPLGGRLECATIKAPLDWHNPKLDKIDVGILRVKAGNPQGRKGAILINPGGPGQDGLLFGAVVARYAITAQAPTTTAKELQQLSATYDFVGFSPRGVGSSVQLSCKSSISTPFINFYTDRSEENVRNMLTEARLYAEACQRNPLSNYINTEQTARDMDLIRILLGDSKLNYLGYSYGTWLGAWYAKLFPQTTGNFVLDSNVDFSRRSLNETFNTQPEAFQNGFEKIAIPYLVRNNAVFELGTSSEEVYGVYDTLPIEVKAVVSIPIRDSLYGASQVEQTGVFLVAAKGLSTVFQANASAMNPDSFLKQVEAYRYAKLDALDAAAREVALNLARGVLVELERQPSPVPIVVDPRQATFTSVSCNDGETIQYPLYWVQLGNRENVLNPLTGGALTINRCVFWNNPTARVPFTPLFSPLLMVQSEFDPATNTKGALNALYSSFNAQMVFVNDEKQHAVFPHSDCVDKAVVQHLLDGTMPNERITNCEANPLPGETQVFPAEGLAPQFIGGGLKTFSLKAEETLADQIHEIVHRNAIRP
jgi:pimeloyl-ACP methyl ester carboxylesterase